MVHQEPVNFLKATVSGFEGTSAILTVEGGMTVRWPIKQLPDDVREGSTIRLIASSTRTEQEEREKLAREVINSLL